MKTDYQNITAFEASLVAFMAVGVLLIGTILFCGLTPHQQDHMLSSLSILDISKQVGQTTVMIGDLIAGEEEFQNQFYIAFTQVAVLPQALVAQGQQLMASAKLTYNQFLNYADQVTVDYNHQNRAQLQLAIGGRVAGVSTERLNLPYSFTPPKWQVNQLKNLWPEKQK